MLSPTQPDQQKNYSPFAHISTSNHTTNTSLLSFDHHQHSPLNNFLQLREAGIEGLVVRTGYVYLDSLQSCTVALILLGLEPRVPVLQAALFVSMSIFWRRGSSLHQKEKQQPELQSEAKVDELKAALGPLSGRSLLYCTDACLRRYLEARNWNVEKAKKMLEETLAWRSTYKPEEIRWHEVAVEGETGKLFRANFHDRYGRTVLILKPGLQNTTSMDNQIKHLVYLMENAMLNLPEGQEEMAWLIDFTGWSFSTNVPVRTAKDTINILQDHYPQRLAVAFLYTPPRVFQAFWKIVKIFMDPKTFQKVKFVYPKNNESVDLMRSYFDVDNLPTEFGGKATMKYDHEDFSRLMAQDDVKAAKFWGFDQKTSSTTAGYAASAAVAAVAPEPAKSTSIIAT
ncbi:hypothetical protein QVD17_02321 [Tagetes erecta]|uniref:CRAL-TRIO domain-containing protein n=1 Tax=Tagetes erecta TaxID=13708 RepID=A0AAD8LFC9_TARER|nr:hypothetical protein QVD17_02321 [Tagetes erecta]